ncbi:MAG: tripartite tricarboxylate transporter substrate-binding protein, partial [Chloroflexota bacterium]
MKRVWLVLGALVLVSFLGACGTAGEAKPADFYKGKNMDFTVATEPGGSVDVVARLVATYLGKHTGATLVVNNRRGAGGVEGVMWVYRAQPDGLTLGTWTSLPLVMNKVDEAPGADYKLEDFGYIMGITREPQAFFVSSKGPYQSVAALQQQSKGKKLGGTSARGNITLGSMSVAHILDLDVKVVTGYKGIEEAVLAMEQGETIGSVFPVSSGMASFKSGRTKPLFIMGTKKFSYWPEVPALTDLVSLTGDKKAEVDLWQSLDK